MTTSKRQGLEQLLHNKYQIINFDQRIGYRRRPIRLSLSKISLSVTLITE